MKIRRRNSGNLEDRRGQRASGGRGLGIPMGGGAGGKLGLPAILIAVVGTLIGSYCATTGGGGGGGLSLPDVFNQLPGAAPGTGGDIGGDIAGEAGEVVDYESDRAGFIQAVFDDAQFVWDEILTAQGSQYREATLVLFDDGVDSGCGFADSRVGPFYCPADEKVYIDLTFFDELASDRFGAGGDFAAAYVIAHEVGHHVQTVLGISATVGRERQQKPDDANELSVKQELQADCFAGIWAYSAFEQGILEAGDIQEGLDAAAAVGDDRIQEQAGQRTNPESWTHGSSEQRQEWFTRGHESGVPSDCDTFD